MNPLAIIYFSTLLSVSGLGGNAVSDNLIEIEGNMSTCRDLMTKQFQITADRHKLDDELLKTVTDDQVKLMYKSYGTFYYYEYNCVRAF